MDERLIERAYHNECLDSQNRACLIDRNPLHNQLITFLSTRNLANEKATKLADAMKDNSKNAADIRMSAMNDFNSAVIELQQSLTTHILNTLQIVVPPSTDTGNMLDKNNIDPNAKFGNDIEMEQFTSRIKTMDEEIEAHGEKISTLGRGVHEVNDKIRNLEKAYETQLSLANYAFIESNELRKDFSQCYTEWNSEKEKMVFQHSLLKTNLDKYKIRFIEVTDAFPRFKVKVPLINSFDSCRTDAVKMESEIGAIAEAAIETLGKIERNAKKEMEIVVTGFSDKRELKKDCQTKFSTNAQLALSRADAIKIILEKNVKSNLSDYSSHSIRIIADGNPFFEHEECNANDSSCLAKNRTAVIEIGGQIFAGSLPNSCESAASRFLKADSNNPVVVRKQPEQISDVNAL